VRVVYVYGEEYSEEVRVKSEEVKSEEVKR
jgi:hypothetical protein